MARRRFIHPDFFHDEHLVTLPPFTRLLFAGLWCLADREGRLPDKPLKIKMQLFPADQVDVDAALADLARLGMVARYVVGTDKYLQINAFGKYQHPHPKEAPSVIPPEGVSQATPRCVSDNTQADPEPRLGVVEQGGYSGSSDTQDLRTHGSAQATPAPPRRTQPLVSMAEHRNHAMCGRPCLPAFLLNEFVRLKGGAEDQADQAVRAWALATLGEWSPDGPRASEAIGDDPIAFWRHRFREWLGTTRAPPSKSAGNAAALATTLTALRQGRAS